MTNQCRLADILGTVSIILFIIVIAMAQATHIERTENREVYKEHIKVVELYLESNKRVEKMFKDFNKKYGD